MKSTTSVFKKKKLPHSFGHQNEKKKRKRYVPLQAELRHYSLLFPCITFAKYIQLCRQSVRLVIYGSTFLHPSLGCLC